MVSVDDRAKVVICADTVPIRPPRILQDAIESQETLPIWRLQDGFENSRYLKGTSFAGLVAIWSRFYERVEPTKNMGENKRVKNSAIKEILRKSAGADRSACIQLAEALQVSLGCSVPDSRVFP